MRKTIAALAIGTIVGSIGFSTQAHTTSATPPLEIVGAWTFNHDLSSKPPERGERDESSRVGAGRGGFGGGLGGLRGGGMSVSSDDRQKTQAVLRRMREAPERLTITSDGKTIAFADSDGRTWKVTTDGKKQTILTGDGEIELKGRIDGAKLIIEENILGRGRLLYTYAPAEDAGTRRLAIQVKLDSGRLAEHMPEMTRIYDMVE